MTCKTENPYILNALFQIMITHILLHFNLLLPSLLIHNSNICFCAHLSAAQCDAKVLETDTSQTDTQTFQRPEGHLKF